MDLPLRVPPSSYSALARGDLPFINRRARSQKKIRRAAVKNMNVVKEMDYCYLKKEKSSFPKTQIKSSLDAYNVIKEFYHDDIDIYESFFILLVNQGLHTTGYAKISQGGVGGTIVDVKIVAKYVVDSLCSNVIVAHNHPSGSLKPSGSDIEVTKKLKAMLKYFDCKILDHVILTSEGFFSFADQGLL